MSLKSNLQKVNPNLTHKFISKLFYGKFPYKLGYRLPGAFALHATRKNDPLSNRILILTTLRRIRNIRSMYNRDIDFTDIEQVSKRLSYLDEQYRLVSSKIRRRIDGYGEISLYFETEEQATKFFRKTKKILGDYICSYSEPQDLKDIKLLGSNSIFVKRRVEYKFKTKLHSNYWNINDLRILNNCVRSTNSRTCRQLKYVLGKVIKQDKNYLGYCLWDQYIYVRDEKSLTWLKLMLGKKIRKSYTLIPKP